MRCHRCHGLLIPEQTLSVDNDFRQVSYTRCVNCGCYQFMKQESMVPLDGTPDRSLSAAAA